MTESLLRVAVVIAATQALVLMIFGATSWTAVIGSAVTAGAVEIYYVRKRSGRR